MQFRHVKKTPKNNCFETCISKSIQNGGYEKFIGFLTLTTIKEQQVQFNGIFYEVSPKKHQCATPLCAKIEENCADRDTNPQFAVKVDTI